MGLEQLTGGRIGPSWDIGPLIARGGMSAVYAARHSVTGRDVAVKVLDPRVFADPVAGERFAREVTASARIRHSGIVDVLDAGTDPDLGLHFVVMELLEGHDLRRELADGPVAIDRALALVDALLIPLGEAHRAGIVHRDLKPENVFLARERDGGSRVVLLDFGIARDLAVDGATTAGTTIGTPHYMAPEQSQSLRSATPASDVWSVGIMLYELLAGAPPFDGETAPAIFIAAATRAPAPLPDAIPRAVREAVGACLQKDPTRRPQSASALRAALAINGARHALLAPRAARPQAPPSAQRLVATTLRMDDGAADRTLHQLVAMFLALVFAAVAVAAWFGFGRHVVPPPPPPPASSRTSATPYPLPPEPPPPSSITSPATSQPAPPERPPDNPF